MSNWRRRPPRRRIRAADRGRPAAQRPGPSLPPMPDAPPPASKPVKPLPPELVDRFLPAIRQGDFESVQALVDGEEASSTRPRSAPADRPSRSPPTWSCGTARTPPASPHFLIEKGATTDVFTVRPRRTQGSRRLTLDSLARSCSTPRTEQGLTPAPGAALVPGRQPRVRRGSRPAHRRRAEVDLWDRLHVRPPRRRRGSARGRPRAAPIALVGATPSTGPPARGGTPTIPSRSPSC